MEVDIKKLNQDVAPLLDVANLNYKGELKDGSQNDVKWFEEMSVAIDTSDVTSKK